MKFLLNSYNFSPEKTGIGKYNGEWADWLVLHGHKVDVITSNPYYPEWKVHEEYAQNKWRVEKRGGLTVFRTPMYIPGEITGKSRILSDISFGITSLLSWLRCFFRPRYDVVIAVCPPMFSGLMAYLYSRFFGAVFVFHIQDLQVDAAAQLGLIKNKTVLRILVAVEQFLLTRADVVSSISEGMKQRLLSKGVVPEKYFMLGNWVDLNLMRPMKSEESERIIRNRLGIPEKTQVVLYSGNMGEKQGLEIIPEVADVLKGRKDLIFLICGEGPAKQRLKEQVTQRELSNVMFLPLQPLGMLPGLLSLAHIHLIPQKKAAADLVLPSKLTGILACGGVTIVGAEKGTTLYQLVMEHNIGVAVVPEDVDSMVRAVQGLLGKDNVEMKLNARRFAEQHLDKETLLTAFEKRVANVPAN